MTLVVARQKQHIVSMVSDTGVVEHGVQLDAASCVPKIAVLGPDLAVALAESPEFAIRTLEELAEAANHSYRPTVDLLLLRPNQT